MRGTRVEMVLRQIPPGIIPAYAGNTCIFQGRKAILWDHPRVCGEHIPVRGLARIIAGSSPRMRGTHSAILTDMSSGGIIPAYAGNTDDVAFIRKDAGDHPRVCGEHRIHRLHHGQVRGSSPRMRGTHSMPIGCPESARIIPAYAGNTVRCLRYWWFAWDHPRVCGEHIQTLRDWRVILGSSPRMRGTPCDAFSEKLLAGIIPAYAGNTARGFWRPLPKRDHPRVCGEHNRTRRDFRVYEGSSPRMRGTHITFPLNINTFGIIPAYAGNTLRDYSNFVVSKFMSFVFHLV